MNTELIGIIISSIVALPASIAALMVAIRQCRTTRSETAPPENPALTTPPTTAPVAAPVSAPVPAPIHAPTEGMTNNVCTTEDDCKKVAESFGLQLGGGGSDFAGNYKTKGLYAYNSGRYAGMAFFGRGGTEAQMKAAVTGKKYRPAQENSVSAPAPFPAPIPMPAPASVPSVINSYIIDFGKSKPSTMSGPWPTNCKEIRVQHDVRTHDHALVIARKQIAIDPANHIIEVVESFIPPVSWTFTVKTFHTKDDEVSNVEIGPGRRFVAWDMSKFKYREKVMQTLRSKDFF